MAYLRAKNVPQYRPLTSTILSIVLMASLLHLPQYQVEAQAADCQTSTEDCVCNSQSIVEYFAEILFVPRSVYAREPRVIYQNIDRFQCTEYIPLPPHLIIRMSDSEELPQSLYFSKRKYRVKRSPGRDAKSRQRRQLSLGIPTEELFQEAIATIPTSRSHHYAVLGSEVTLNCYGEGNNGWEEQGVSGSFRKFEWTHGHNQPITAPLVRFDQATGDLFIMSVRLADTGIYTCTIKSGEQELGGRGDVDLKRFRSQLDVIATPMLWLRFWLTYTVDRCRQRELLEIQRQVKDLIHQYVCYFCPVRNISVNCVNLGRGSDDGKKYVEISLTLSTLGLERLLPQWEHASKMCPVDCQEAMHAKVFSALLASLTKLFNLQISVELLDGKTSVYTPVPKSMNDDIALGCPSGFFENYKLCFPCAAGQYSPDGKSECVLCREGFFQPNPGSSDCFRCPKGHTTLDVGSRSQMDCVFGAVNSTFKFAKLNWMIVSIGGAAGLLVLLIIMICCCCPNSGLGKCVRCIFCCGGDNEDEGGNPERQIARKGGYEKLIPDQPDEEFYGNEEREEMTEMHEGRRGRKHNRGRPRKAPRFLRDEDYNYDDRRSLNNVQSPPKHESEPQNENESFKQKLEAFERKSASDKARVTPTFLKHSRKIASQKQPQSPTNFPTRLPICNFKTVDLDHHQLSEQTPARPYLKEEEEETSSSVSSRFRKIPHLKMGNVLNKSKSLMEKLAVQRHKLGETSSRSRSRSPSSRSDRSPDMFESSPRHPPSLLKGSKQASSDKRRVNILEHKNIYHNYKDKNVKKPSKSKSRDPDSSAFDKPVSERIKSFQIGGKRR